MKKKKAHGSFCKVHKNTKLGRKHCKPKTKKKGRKKKLKRERTKGFIWITKFDSKTCRKCAGRHGKTYPLSKPPDLLHDYCRCQLYLL